MSRARKLRLLKDLLKDLLQWLFVGLNPICCIHQINKISAKWAVKGVFWYECSKFDFRNILYTKFPFKIEDFGWWIAKWRYFDA